MWATRDRPSRGCASTRSRGSRRRFSPARGNRSARSRAGQAERHEHRESKSRSISRITFYKSPYAPRLIRHRRWSWHDGFPAFLPPFSWLVVAERRPTSRTRGSPSPRRGRCNRRGARVISAGVTIRRVPTNVRRSLLGRVVSLLAGVRRFNAQRRAARRTELTPGGDRWCAMHGRGAGETPWSMRKE